ncbi:MAG: peptide chain release factor 2, partial [Candidatus Omnitrophica bacterium]|nr:peptide chain release factor 2 [Candidatus Omnitrophota bacterium]
DETILPEVEKSIHKFNKELEKLEIEALFTDEYDTNNAIVGFHAGAGGTESCDWANMLLRMYLRWAEKKGFQSRIIDYLPGEEAGVKNVTVIISGAYAYGYLKAESGVHRLVRISPFDANKRRHTSFASVDVIPELEEDIEVDIKDEDLRIDIYRASGPGGQGVNTTDSAVRIVHLPTKIMVQCQNERSQHKNKAMAMKVLKARLYQHYLEKRKEEMEEKWGDKKDIAWGSQIRSYVFQPYTMIKDHRTNLEIGNVQKVMDGGIDPFIEAYLRQSKENSKK